MTQQIINTGTTPDSGDGDTLYTAFTKTNENFTEIYDAGPVGSNIQIANNTITTTVVNSNIILGPSGIGKVTFTNGLLPTQPDIYNIGSSAYRVNTIYVGTGGISAQGNVAGTYFIGNGSLLTGITVESGTAITNGTSNVAVAANSAVTVGINGTSNVAVFDQGNTTIAGNLLPSANVTYNLGSDTQRWNALYLAGNTIYLGAQTLTTTANGIATSGNTLQIGNAAIYTSGNTVYVQDPEGGNVAIGGEGANGNITVTNVTASGNVTAGLFLGNGAALSNVMTDRGGDTTDWNSLTQMGVYKVNRDSWSGVTGAPTDSLVFVGVLTVMTTGDTTTQIFYPGTVNSSDVRIQWNRSLWNGTWTSWIKMTSNGQVIDAGGF